MIDTKPAVAWQDKGETADADQWREGSRWMWLDHHQFEIRHTVKNGTDIAVYVNLGGSVSIENAPSMWTAGPIVVEANGLMAFTVEEWRIFTRAVDEVLARDERYQAQLEAIGGIVLEPGQWNPTAEQMLAVMRQFDD